MSLGAVYAHRLNAPSGAGCFLTLYAVSEKELQGLNAWLLSDQMPTKDPERSRWVLMHLLVLGAF